MAARYPRSRPDTTRIQPHSPPNGVSDLLSILAAYLDILKYSMLLRIYPALATAESQSFYIERRRFFLRSRPLIRPASRLIEYAVGILCFPGVGWRSEEEVLGECHVQTELERYTWQLSGRATKRLVLSPWSTKYIQLWHRVVYDGTYKKSESGCGRVCRRRTFATESSVLNLAVSAVSDNSHGQRRTC